MTVDVITNNSKCFLSSCTLKHFARQKSFLLLRTTLRLGTVPVNNEYHKYELLFNEYNLASVSLGTGSRIP